MVKLDLQLDNYIDDMRQNDIFKGIVNLAHLSVKLVQTNRHTLYNMVYTLFKLAWLLPIATTSIERVLYPIASEKSIVAYLL